MTTKLTLDDMIAEIASDQVTQIDELLRDDRYEEAHEILQPLFAEYWRNQPREYVERYYQNQIDDSAELT